MAGLKLQAVTKSWDGKTQVIKPLTLDVADGEFIVPFFNSIRGALPQSQPRYYVTANQSKRGVFGIRRPLVGGHCRVCRGLHKDGGHGPEIW